MAKKSKKAENKELPLCEEQVELVVAPQVAEEPAASLPEVVPAASVEEPDAARGEDSAPAAPETPPVAPKKRTRAKKNPKPQAEEEAAAPAEKAVPVGENAPAVNTEHLPEAPAEEKAPAEQVAAPAPAEKQLPPAERDTLPAVSEPRAVERAVPPIAFEALVQERRNFFKFLIMFLILGAAMVASAFILLYRPNHYSQRTASVAFWYHEDTAQTTVSYNGKAVGEAISGVCNASMYDATGRRCAALIGETLYLVEADGVREVASAVADFLLSQNGATLVYRTADNQLYYCPVKKELAPSRISGDTRDNTYCLSPDGKELFYTYVQNDVMRIDVYSATNSKPHFAKVTGLIPVAVADSCEFLYYKNADTGELFYYEQQADAPVLCYNGADAPTLTFNRDFSELILQSTAGTQILRRGKRLTISLLKGSETLEFLPNQCAERRVLQSGVQLLVRSFERGYYLKRGAAEDGTMLMYLGKKGELTLVRAVKDGESHPVVTDKAVYFLEIEQRSEQEILRHLYRCEIGKTEPERISWDVAEFCVNTDGSRVMYTDHHGALYALQIGKVPVRHADSIDAGTLCVSAEDAFYYYVGEALYVSDNGEAPRVAREDADKVGVDAYTAYFLVKEESGTYTVYANHRNRRRDVQLATGITLSH